jgi:nitrite reductase/ring-hydroxylating ferredoxin subunit
VGAPIVPGEPTGSGPSDDGWIPVLTSDQLPEGRAVKVALEGSEVFLYRTAEHLYALANRCTHQGGPLDRGLIGHVGDQPTVTCPMHGSLFLLGDGRVLRGPASRPQPTFRVRERDGSIEISDPA